MIALGKKTGKKACKRQNSEDKLNFCRQNTCTLRQPFQLSGKVL